MTFHQMIDHPYYLIAYTSCLLIVMLFVNFSFSLISLKNRLAINKWQVFCSYFFKINCRLILLSLIVLCEFVITPIWLIPLDSVAQDFLASPDIRSAMVLLFVTNVLMIFFIFCFFHYHLTDCLTKTVQSEK